MTQNTIIAGDATNSGVQFGGGNDGTLLVQVGPAGGKLTGISIDAAGRVAFPQSVVAFKGYQNAALSVPNATYTKVTLQAKEFDTTNAFDSTTNYRFQPQVAGYYQVIGSIRFGNPLAGQAFCTIYKNGIEYARGSDFMGTSTAYVQQSYVNTFVYLNGSTDYLELWTFQSSGGAQSTTAGLAFTFFQGMLMAKA